MVVLRRAAFLLLSVLLALPSLAGTADKDPTQNVIMVMTDGLRWQEVFRGPEPGLINSENKVKDEAALRKAYWRDTADARREALMPFLWGTVAKRGQIFGNRDKGSDAYVTNHMWFSYPGYNETLSGFADDLRITSNDKIPNPNVTVFEWLNRKSPYQGRVAAVGAWGAFPAIFNSERAGIPVMAGYDALTFSSSERIDLLNQLKAGTPQIFEDEMFDSFTFYSAIEYLKQRKPRVFFISLGETDEWAHGRNYPNYLDAAHRVDSYLRILWDTLQSMPEYRDKTTLIFSPDHGRGDGAKWTDHGSEQPGSNYIWMAFLGPGTKALGERTKAAAVTQSQIAATVAALLGEDYNADVPKAGKPIVEVLP